MSTGPDPAMFPSVGDLDQLSLHLLNLKSTWHVFDRLYLDAEANAVFSATCRATAFEIGRSLVEHTVIQLARMLEGAEDGQGNERLTLTHVRKRLEKEFPAVAADATYLAKLAAIRAELDPLRMKIRAHRGAWIAHLDKAHATKTGPKLPPLPFSEVRRTIELVEALVQLLNSTFRNVGMSFGWHYADGPEALIRALEKPKEKSG